MTSHKDYALKGRLGIATPQANPTVEAEMRRLLPIEVDYVTLRLTSPSADPVKRLKAYLMELEIHARQFAGMHVDALLFGCTASSYLVDRDAEAAALAAAERAFKAPVILATAALKAELVGLGVKRIALASPYPAPIMSAAVDWWQGEGFEVVASAGIDIGSSDTINIYGLTSADAWAALAEMDLNGAEAVVSSGTGMPSLPVLRRLEARFVVPVISSNLALARQGLKRLGLEPATY